MSKTKGDLGTCAHARVEKDGGGRRVCRDCGEVWSLPLLNQHLPKTRCTKETLAQLEALTRARGDRSTSDTLRDLVDEAWRARFGS